MTQLLVSVRSAVEVPVALAGGADVIDAKDPSRGALGELPIDVVREIVAATAGKRRMSATLGDGPWTREHALRAFHATLDAGADFAKAGASTIESALRWLEWLTQSARADRFVLVLFADDLRLQLEQVASLDALFQRVAESGIHALMVDTHNKAAGSLLTHVGRPHLSDFARLAREHRVRFGLAGSLTVVDAAALAHLRPDYLGFRGAACVNGIRGETIDTERVMALKYAIDSTQARATPAVQSTPLLEPHRLCETA